MATDPRHLDSDALQEHTRSLRTLAKAIVGNPHDADDLTQDAWVTALDRPVKKGWSLTNWLRGITRNHARQRSRDEGRRVKRERAAAVPERMPPEQGPDQSIERVDLLRHLLEHVRHLDEPYRSTVLLRYFDGLTPQEVAKRLNIPHATVRTRLHRGIEQLRQRMDDAHGGDRKAWALPLIPFITAPNLTPVAPITETVAQSGSELAGQGLFAVSTKKVAAGLAVALTGTLLTVTFWPEDETPIGENGEQVRSIEADELGKKTGGGPLGKQSIQDQRKQVGGKPPDTAKTKFGKAKTLVFVDITGTVTDTNGKPIAGADISFGKKTAKSGAEGTYFISSAAAKDMGKSGEVWATGNVRARGFLSTQRTVRGAQDKTPLRVDFTMRKGFLVTGRVVTKDGTGIANARVRSFSAKRGREARTDADGMFELDDVDPAEPKGYLQAESRGYVTSGALFSTEAKATAQVEIVLQRGSVVRGIVYGPNRKLIAGAEVSVNQGKTRSWTKSDKKGAFEFVGVKPGKGRLSAQHPHYVSTTRTIQVPQPGTDLDLVIELLRGDTLTGFVRDEAGQPIPACTVRAGKTKGEQAITDEAGAFTLSGVKPGNIHLECRAISFLTKKTTTPSSIRGLVITLEKSALIAGRVVDARTQQPVREFTVRFLGATGKGKAKGWSWSFRNDEGLWDTRRLSLRTGFVTDIEIRAKGYAPALRERVTAQVHPDPDQVRIALDTGTRLTGHVLTETSHTPVAGATIRIVGDHAPSRKGKFQRQDHAMTRTDAKGGFTFEHVAPGSFQLSIEHADFGLSLHPITIAAATESTTKTILLGKQGSLNGVVLGPDNQPVRGEPIRVTLVNAKGLRGRSWNTTTDKTGNYTFTNLPFGVYRVARTEKTGKRFETIARFVRITNKVPRKIDLLSTAGGSVRGTANGYTAGWLLVTLTPEEPEGTDWEKRRTTRRALSQSSTFSLDNVAAGTYQVKARVYPKGEAEPMIGEAKITIEAGKANPLTIELKPDPNGGK